MSQHFYSTISEAITSLRRRGFTADFKLCNGIEPITANGHSFKTEELTIVEHHRFEGVSDPDDSSVIYALEGVNGIKGLLIDAYGTYADAGIAAALQPMKDNHEGSP